MEADYPFRNREYSRALTIDPSIVATNSSTSLDALFTNQAYQMSLPLRMDVAAVLAYGLGPIGATAMLVGEHYNDYVRFHAWQSLLWSTAAGLFMLTVVLVGGVGWWVLAALAGGIVINAMLAWTAYQRTPSLQVFYIPLLGHLASLLLYSE